MLLEEEQYDNQKRQQYGQQWKRPPSNIVQNQYRTNIDCNNFVTQPMKLKQSKLIK